MLPLVALVGRPNVGKSTLFNALIKRRKAITHDRPGVTRDRVYGEVRSASRPFAVVDTGGLVLSDQKGLDAQVLEQAREAVRTCHLALLVVDAREGLNPVDEEAADLLRKSGRPVLVAANKIDGPEQEKLVADFLVMGLEVQPVSGAHRHRVQELAERIADLLAETGAVWPEEPAAAPAKERVKGRAGRRKGEPAGKSTREQAPEPAGKQAREQAGQPGDREQGPEEGLAEEPTGKRAREQARGQAGDLGGDKEHGPEGGGAEEQAGGPSGYREGPEGGQAEEQAEEQDREQPSEQAGLRLALLGKPNAGKSSIVNRLLGERRLIVSDQPGTTRDSVDVTVERGGRRYTFVDTAGVRRRTKIDDSLERFSVTRALAASRRADVAVLVADATEGITAQDKRLLTFLDEEKKPFIVAVNKVDLAPRSEQASLKRGFAEALSIVAHAPVIYTSAVTGAGLGGLLPLAEKLFAESSRRIGTGELNRALREVTTRHQAPMVKGRRAKFYYLTQPETNPPGFVFFVNDPEIVKPSYVRYLDKQLRKLFNLNMTPIRIHFRPSHNKKA
jgi:small GTP-binding protein